jgi:NADH-quinone oxidoreductase subunit G
VIYRITPRQNDAVNDTWMADSGRLLYRAVRADSRLTAVRVAGTDGSLEQAVAAAAALLRPGSAAVVGSGRSTVEEQFLTRRLAAAVGAGAHLVARLGPGDKLLVSADRNPNVRGALVTGLIAALPALQLTGLAAEIDAGKVKTVVSLGEDLVAAGITAAQLARVKVIYLGTHANATSAAAEIVVPTLTVFEKQGTFVNQQFRIQKFAAAVPGPAGAADDLAVLSKLIAAVGGPAVPAEIHGVWTALAAAVPQLGPIAYRNLPAGGLLLDGAAWAQLAFAEGETLHYQPAARPA